MNNSFIKISGRNLPLYDVDVLVIGTGCAGFNGADWLYDLGVKNIAVVTEGINKGTSRNTGSDKQTYYKLSLSSSEEDSVKDMAKSLFAGKSVNGDTALIEAACSARSFIKLSNLGVPFPTNIYGEYVGYMTDHDIHKRATSAGPLTSKYMTEALEKSVVGKGIQVLDKIQIFKLFKNKGRIIGALGIRTDSGELALFRASNIIMATGGPAGIYEKSVFPKSQTGMSGMAIELGVKTANLQEWQYGLASVDFRWNVSGTYQQVIPRYISVDKDGNEREFLLDYLSDEDCVNLVFMKGYQWPFDTAKINGSSVVDMIIYNETVKKGNKVYMDFRKNPKVLENGFDILSDEASDYLKNSNALFGKPIDRLEKMNRKAIELYASHGIDLYNEPLRVEVCAQHNNGGIAVDLNWETNIKGLYVAGEAAGTFGVSRPGGSALNSTQVGSLRAAEHIAFEGDMTLVDDDVYMAVVQDQAADVLEFVSASACENYDDQLLAHKRRLRTEMSANAAFIRNHDKICGMIDASKVELSGIYNDYKGISKESLPEFFKLRDMLITRIAVLTAMEVSCREIGTRGGALCIENEEALSDVTKIRTEINTDFDDKILITDISGGYFEQIREIPHSDLWFENVWNDYLERRKRN